MPGSYAGRARFHPSHPDRVPLSLRQVIGQIVEVGHAGIAAAGDPFAGQAMFLEWRRDDQLGGFLIPEQDLQFCSAAERPAAALFGEPCADTETTRPSNRAAF